VLYMLEVEMTVGPKGQVVIPKALRDALKIHPGSKVVFKLEDNRVIVEKQGMDSVAVFERVARSGKHVRNISPHGYESELEDRGKYSK
jgi:AbrB family looped-hinge helix DNA binding protein